MTDERLAEIGKSKTWYPHDVRELLAEVKRLRDRENVLQEFVAAVVKLDTYMDFSEPFDESSGFDNPGPASAASKDVHERMRSLMSMDTGA